MDDRDRESFVSRLCRELEATRTVCYAWVLMENHLHLLLRPHKLLLADFMRRLLTGHAVVFNHRHQRTGHLFQNRYKSIVCDQDAYLLELIRYIHLNPIRAGVLAGLDELFSFPWSGHREILGKVRDPISAAEEVLQLFSTNRNAARDHYLTYLADGLRHPLPYLSRGGKQASLSLDPSLNENEIFDERILGGGAFVESLLKCRVPETVGQSLDFEKVMATVLAYYQVDRKKLSWPCKERSLAKCRAVLCYVYLREMGMSGVKIGEMVALSPSGVTRAAKRGEKLLQEDDILRERVQA